MVQISQIVYIRRKPKESTRFTNAEAKQYNNDSLYIIGGAIRGDGQLRGLNPEEESKYLAKILSKSPTALDWDTVSLAYWENIRKKVPSGIGLKLEIGWEFPSKEKAEEARNDFASTSSFKSYENCGGVPINISDYVLYRYCLVYRAVANNYADAFKSPRILFYMHSEEDKKREEYMKMKQTRDANERFSRLIGEPKQLAALVRCYGENPRRLDQFAQELFVDAQIKANPEKFLATVNDKNLEARAFVQEACSYGVLRRLPNTGVTYYGDALIGHTEEEAIAFLSNPKNAAAVTEPLQQQVKAKREADTVNIV